MCLYSEGTIYPPDFGFLPNALAATASVQPQESGAVLVESEEGVELATGRGPRSVRVDGVPWPAVRERTVLVPKGRHLVEWREGAPEGGAVRLRDINAVLLGAEAGRDSLSVRYASPARAFLTLSWALPRGVRIPPFAPSTYETTWHGWSGSIQTWFNLSLHFIGHRHDRMIGRVRG